MCFFWGFLLVRGFGGGRMYLMVVFWWCVRKIVLEISQRLTKEFYFFLWARRKQHSQDLYVWMVAFLAGPSFWFWPMAPGLFSMKTFRCFRFSNFILL